MASSIELTSCSSFPSWGIYTIHVGIPAFASLLYGKYRIAYLNRGDIYVLGVFHGALDLKRHLSLKPDAS